MNFINVFAFLVALSSNEVTTTISAYANVAINNIQYLEYEYYYEEHKSITINLIDSVDVDILLNLKNVSTDGQLYSYNEDGDVHGYEWDFDTDQFISELNDFKNAYREEFNKYILEEKILSTYWFYTYLNFFDLNFIGNSYSIVPVAEDPTNSAYSIACDIYMELTFDFTENFSYVALIEEFEYFVSQSVNGLNVGMSFLVKNENLGDFYWSRSNATYEDLDYSYDRGFENGRFEGLQVGYETGYSDAIRSQPNSVLELVTKPFVEMGKFLNISVAPNLTLGMIIAVPIVVAIIGFLIKALIA